MPFPKISNPFEDEQYNVESQSISDVTKNVGNQVAKQVQGQVVKPTVQQTSPTTTDIVNQLYGVKSDSSQESGVEQPQMPHAQAGQQKIDPTKQMTANEQSTYSQEQKELREKMRLHIRNYANTPSGIDPIGTLEEQVAKERQKREQRDMQRKKEDEEEEQKKKQLEKQKQEESLAMSQPKKRVVKGQIVIRREQTKAETFRGTSG